MRNVMSVDVEEWFQVGAFEKVINPEDWPQLSSRVERNVHRILDIFDDAHVKASFFTLGWIAQRHPALIREIVNRGHEVASHGYDHKRVFTLNAHAFAEDLKIARMAIEDAIGAQIHGYRAPSFSIDQRCPWAFDVLADAGYLYSSSVAPVVHDHYGWPDAPRFAFKPLADADFVEIPVTTAMFGKRRLAAGGGGFFRLLPYRFMQWAIDQVNIRDNMPAVFYFHPWEIDPDQPRVADAPLRSKLRHYTNLSKMEGKLIRLLTQYHWGPMDEVARHFAALLKRGAR